MSNKSVLGCLFSSALLLSTYSATVAQNETKTITTAVPFLTITPDSRAGGMGEAGSALSADANAMYWNTGKLAFNTQDFGAAVSYTPWLKYLNMNDLFVSYLSGYKKLRKEDAIGISMTYFSLGALHLTDESNNPLGDVNSNEYAISAAYSRQLSKTFGVGVAPKFIHSNLAGNGNYNGSSIRPANTVAVDLSAFYTKEINLNGRPAQMNLAGSITNFGPKVSYSDNNRRDFIPTTLRLGGSLTSTLDAYNTITFSLDLSKLMVPSPDSSKNLNDKSFISGAMGSFTDAPGGGKEELQEVMIGAGVEYWYDKLFALRGGYFHEAKEKGNRKYFTAGLGLRYQRFGVDFAYLVPVAQNSPLAETLRFSLLFDFEKAQKVVESVTD
ncbi:hypothetical protein SAMN05421780_10774 [Flexibacter flexilis DSM 6793]|uniref:Type IX secretion system protein PorV domain-containing protein n=1 Tax=Flexibacter flexilis DSM 6793 TaxID=927664 RepID=A0A1I1KII2_9BACT|nr:type IX secretion system outer membrane channel protein PorV [Flexibacter flexilis]SFC60461.1 hypothetical protein SAMN05421780_10774 [Flexibacter flexilis DSM 6793]